MSVYNSLENLINRRGSKERVAEELECDGIGRYMANRWISMTSAKNAVVSSMFNFYGGVDTVGGLCGVASLFCGNYGYFKYLKKSKQKVALKMDDEEWPDRFSQRERNFLQKQLEWFETRNKKKRRDSSKNGKKE